MIKFLLPALLLLAAWLAWRKWQRAGRERYIVRYPYAERLDKRLAARCPELSKEQRETVLDCLGDYFQLCNRAGKRMVAMPSQAVDEAWHEFILFTRLYDSFCRKAFGRFLHHTPAEAMRSPTEATAGLKRAWRLACAHEGINPSRPERLPRLFALDAMLGLTGGFVYRLDCLTAQQGGVGDGFCASHIGCSSGCASDSDGSSGDSGCGGSGCGGD